MPIGDPTADVLYGPMIDERFAERFEGGLADRDHHITSGSSGSPDHRVEPLAGFVGDPDAGRFYHLAIVDGVTADDDLYATETFGPIVGVARFETFDEAMALANGHGYGLSSSIYTTDPCTRSGSGARSRPGWSASTTRRRAPRRTCRSAATARAGTAPPVGHLVLDQFTRWQAMNWDYSGACRRRRWTSPT